MSTPVTEKDQSPVLDATPRDNGCGTEAGRHSEHAQLAFLRAVVSNLPVLLFAFDGDGICTLAEGELLDSIELPMTVGMALPDLYASRPEMLDAVQRTLQGGSFTTMLEIGPYHLDASCRPLRDERNHIVGGMVTGVDVTDRQLLETDLRQSQKLEAIGRLAGGIAHEINTPIQFVGDNVRFLHESFETTTRLLTTYRNAIGRDTDISWEEQLAVVTEAEAAADVGFLTQEVPQAAVETLEGVERVATIVRAMKAFGHPSTREQVTADLNEALRNTLIVGKGEYRLVADVATEFAHLPPVRCQLGELNQVFLNLVINAAHAIADSVGDSGRRGRILVRTRLDEQQAVIEISDDGCGIPEHLRQAVFEPFFTTKDVGKGTGQGLALARAVVEGHNGTIAVESAVGQGTTFTIRLPLGGVGLRAGNGPMSEVQA